MRPDRLRRPCALTVRTDPEFGSPGVTIHEDGSATVVIQAFMFAFLPLEIRVPRGRDVTFRMTLPAPVPHAPAHRSPSVPAADALRASVYYMSVTAHGVLMAIVFTTFFIMGFGYASYGGSKIAQQWVAGTGISAVGGLLLFISAACYVAVMLGTGLAGRRIDPEPIRLAGVPAVLVNPRSRFRPAS